MSIVYIHGVKVRSADHGKALRKPFVDALGGHLAGSQTEYLPVFWGDAAADFRWGLKSRPRTALLGQGGGAALAGLAAARLAPEALLGAEDQTAAQDGALLGGPAVGQSTDTDRFGNLPAEERPDLLADLYFALRSSPDATDPLAETPALAAVPAAAERVALRWNEIIADDRTDADMTRSLMAAMEAEVAVGGLLAQGGDGWLDRAGELVRRAVSTPGDLISTAFAEGRPAANEFIANFLGDVLIYLHNRGDAGAPGEIPRRVLDALRAAARRKAQTGERIVVVTHSMGGQLLYDAVTRFADGDDELKTLEIDHWISCGAQVSFFAELGLFLGQPATRGPARLPKPARVLKWTNYFDRNDLVGFVMEPVFDGVKDRPYDTGYGLALAHTGFLGRPSFFKAIAEEIKPR